MKKISLIILGILIAAQLLIPASMILKHESILRTGTLYRFKTRPVDPADPFQGRYVQLNFENDYIPGSNKKEPAPEYKERVFVTLSTNADGFCELKTWSRTQPESGDYMKLKFSGPKQNWGETNALLRYEGLTFALPFDRFYMDENKAPRAEQLARRRTPEFSQRDNSFTNCWANVRVLKGNALIEDVLIDGTPISELSNH